MSYWVKSTDGMMVKDRSLEPPHHRQDGYLTSADRFFVCNSGTTPRLDADTHKIRVHGEGVGAEAVLSMTDLHAMPQRTVPAVMECAGNHRALFRDVMGMTLDKRPRVTELLWTFGAIGMAEWRGVPLRHVLEIADIRPDAYHVCAKGAETDSLEGEVLMPIPVEKAMDEDTILALEMNGVPLPPDHGFPVRVVVPGWVGTYSIKWVREIEVRNSHVTACRNTDYYVMHGDGHPREGEIVTEQSIKSTLSLPWPATLPKGTHVIRGYARSPGCPIARVAVSTDAGRTWADVDLIGPNEKWGWTRFQFRWRAEPGEHILMTRATDENGRTQPDSVPFNYGGYLFNAVHPHKVTVTHRKT